MTEFTRMKATCDTRLVSADGVHAMQLAAGEVRPVRNAMLASALAAGCRPMDVMPEAMPEPDPAPVPDPEAGVSEVLDAIKLIFQLGDAKQLTLTGDPKIKAIEDLVGHPVDRDERDQALQLYREDAE